MYPLYDTITSDPAQVQTKEIERENIYEKIYEEVQPTEPPSKPATVDDDKE